MFGSQQLCLVMQMFTVTVVLFTEYSRKELQTYAAQVNTAGIWTQTSHWFYIPAATTITR